MNVCIQVIQVIRVIIQGSRVARWTRVCRHSVPKCWRSFLVYLRFVWQPSFAFQQIWDLSSLRIVPHSKLENVGKNSINKQQVCRISNLHPAAHNTHNTHNTHSTQAFKAIPRLSFILQTSLAHSAFSISFRLNIISNWLSVVATAELLLWLLRLLLLLLRSPPASRLCLCGGNGKWHFVYRPVKAEDLQRFSRFSRFSRFPRKWKQERHDGAFKPPYQYHVISRT